LARESGLRKMGRQVELLSRNGRSLAVAFPEIVAALTALPTDAVLDCELVVVDQRGHLVMGGHAPRAIVGATIDAQAAIHLKESRHSNPLPQVPSSLASCSTQVSANALRKRRS